MRMILTKMAVLGALALAGIAAAGVTTASAQCGSPGESCGPGRVFRDPGLGPEPQGAPRENPPVYNNNAPIYDNTPIYREGNRRHWRDGRRGGWRNNGWRHSNRHLYVDRYVEVYPEPRYYNDYYYDEPVYEVRMSRRHVRWCENRYQTYRRSDNTYKPTLYTRAQCISPYS